MNQTIKKIALSILLLCSGLSVQATGSQGDYQKVLEAFTLGVSLVRTDISCEKFVTNFIEFDKVSEEISYFMIELGDLEARDMESEMRAKVNVEFQKIFDDHRTAMIPNLNRCAGHLSAIEDIVK